MPKSRSSCSVYNCSNTYENTAGLEHKVRFYNLPSKPWEKERRLEWIKFCKRCNSDGSPWTPTKYSLICSTHFVGNTKSENPRSESFNPSLHNNNININNSRVKLKKEKFYSSHNERNHKLSLNEDIIYGDISQSGISKTDPKKSNLCIGYVEETDINKKNNLLYSLGILEEKLQQNVGTQTKFTDEYAYPFSKFLSFSNGSEASTWVTHPITISNNKVVEKSDLRPLAQIELKCAEEKYFKGYSSIENSLGVMADLCSVSPKIFALLLRNLPDSSSSRSNNISMENRLTMFLMKMKLGINFESLAVLFGISASTVSDLFFATLYQLYNATKSWIVWLSRAAIKNEMPVLVKTLYPKCRGIIDILELNIEKSKYVKPEHFGSLTVHKYCLVVAPNGLVTFLSSGYDESYSDGSLIGDSGILDVLEPGDLVLSCKDYSYVSEKFLVRKVKLEEVPKVDIVKIEKDSEQMQKNNMRNFVDEVVRIIKTHNIINEPFTEDFVNHLDKIVHICGVLTNLLLD